MLNGKFRGEDIGSGTDVVEDSGEAEDRRDDEADMIEAESCMSRSAGHCMTMGTASTMASMVEALGMGLPTNAAIPAVDSRREVLARMAGRRIVEMVDEDLRDVADPHAAGVRERDHRERRDRRLDQRRRASDRDRAAALACRSRSTTGTLGATCRACVNLMPSGEFLMEDFYYAGGLPVVIKRDRRRSLHKDALTVNGAHDVGERAEDALNCNENVITPFDNAVQADRAASRCCAATWRRMAPC